MKNLNWIDIYLLHLLLVVRESKRANAAVARREGVEQRQVEGAPHFDDALVAAGHQVLAVATQQQTLKHRG